ncbi:transposase [Streptomyces sp. NPDC058280]|uniref:transposase n=1 Tax=Streptomyces sp. NPDC058280 TaxID=3346419 RepID=UPI0036EC6AE8
MIRRTAGVITASESSWTAPFTGLSPRAFAKLMTVLRREGADAVRRGRPWSLPLEDRTLPGNRNDCKAWEESGAKAAVGTTITIADGGYPGTGLVMPHRRRKGEELPDWKQAHNKSHKQVRARVEHVFARMKTWKILRDCRLKGDSVHHAMLGIARMHNLALAG